MGRRPLVYDLICPALEQAGRPLTIVEVAEAIGRNREYCRKRLAELYRAGLVDRAARDRVCGQNVWEYVPGNGRPREPKKPKKAAGPEAWWEDIDRQIQLARRENAASSSASVGGSRPGSDRVGLLAQEEG